MFLFSPVSLFKSGVTTTPVSPLSDRASREFSDRFCLLLLAFIACAWLLPGIFAHGPWKQDETYTFGIIHNMLVTGDYLVPTNAGQPFMEKPPLYYWTAVVFAKALHPWLDYADGARVTSVFYNLITLFFVARIAQLIWNERKLFSLPVLGTLALFAGSPGMVKHAHDMFTDVALVCGGAMATYGLLSIALNEQRHSPALRAALWFGLGIGITQMTKGLFIPLIFAATAMGVGVLVRECRSASYWKMVGIAVLVSLPFFIIWPALLAQHSIPLFMEWFWDNNVGRFFGFSVAKLGSDNDHTVIFRALSGFALPGSILAVLALVLGDWRNATAPRIALPLIFSALSIAVLQSSATARQLYLLPILLPLIMVGASVIPRLPDWLHLTWDWFARIAFGVISAILWATYVVSTMPVEYHHWIAYFGKWLPLNFVTPIQPLAIAGAAAMSIGWLWALNKFKLTGKWRGAFSWFAGITLMWGLTYTLLLPWGDYAKSYEYVYGDLRGKISSVWKDGDCMASLDLGESEAPMLYYYTGILHQPVDGIRKTQCNWFIQGSPVIPPTPEGHWVQFWEGHRDGDDGQMLKVFRRAE